MAIAPDEMNKRLLAFVDSPDCRMSRMEYDELSIPERNFRSVWELEAEVNNGGFEQYFTNSTGSLAPHAVAALQAIGAWQAASIVARAVAAAGSDIPWHDDGARLTLFENLPDEVVDDLNDLDSEFYAYPDSLTGLLYDYACAHRADLGLDTSF